MEAEEEISLSNHGVRYKMPVVVECRCNCLLHKHQHHILAVNYICYYSQRSSQRVGEIAFFHLFQLYQHC